jgi:UDP-sulfoquinovose synthase
MVQAVSDYPLTVYGKGGQTRGYLNIRDTLQCVHAAEKNAPTAGNLNIYNQIMETFTVTELALLTQEAGKDLGYDVVIDNIENPRIEKEQHYYNPTYQSLQDLGVKPNFLTVESMKPMLKMVESFKSNINSDSFMMGVKW